MVVGIGADKSGYWRHLMNYIRKEGDIQASLWTKDEVLREVQHNTEIDMLFLQKELFEEEVLDFPHVYFTLTKEGKDAIYRFQPVERVYQEMLHLGREKKSTGEQKRHRIFCVYSPLGRSGKTSYALAYAKENSFFYIGLEEYGITGKNSSIEELLYYIKNRNTEITERMRNLSIQWKGVKILASPVLTTDLIQISGEDIRWFLEQIRNDGSLSSVMIDFGTGAVSDLEIFDYFDHIIIPVLKGETEERKMNCFMEMLFEVNGDLRDRIEKIIVPACSWEEEGFLEGVLHIDGLEI